MKTVKGIWAEAKIYTDDVEDYALAQVKMICDNEAAKGSRICLMPDIHPGKVGPIGLSMTVTDRVIQRSRSGMRHDLRKTEHRPRGISETGQSDPGECTFRVCGA